jgi:diguanylate cyclase (GGDEF)-like protein
LKEGATSGPPRDAQTLEAQLERLLATPTGCVIYDQLARIVAEWQGVDTRVAHTYSGLLRLLLDDFASDPSSERILFLVGRLIQLQTRHGHTVSLPVASVTPTEFAARLADQDGFRVALVTLLERLNAASPIPPQPKHAAHSAREFRPENQYGEHAGQRANGANLQQSERQHGVSDKSQDTLALKVRDAMAKNKQLGDLLRIEMGALLQIDSVEEIDTFRQILIGGVEELLQGQAALAGSLNSTGDYLRIIESDSERLQDELHKARLMSLTDEFTGLPNRRAFMRRLEDEIGRAQRYDTPLSLAIVDLDEFKIINDTFGHVAGDQVLQCYAEHMLSTFRHHDLVARYGGEEFAVLLPNTTLEGAQRALSKVQSRVAKNQCIHDGRALLLPTFSAGLALYFPGEQPVRFIEKADRALYRAKHLGRNRIEQEPPAGQSPTPNVAGKGTTHTPEP